ncbi:MAG: 4Fe-4S binding protein [Lachnospiraceae bacterium]|nr:4Fe-4S binding protein [Lachnospiraceae bacterium]
MKKLRLPNLRLWVQIIYTIVTNGYAYGFLNGKIYKGALKYACVPGLNCYSCPGALGSCPLGALQAALNERNMQVPWAVLGFLFIFGSLFGRFVCGWLCPFGLVQDLLYKIPTFGKSHSEGEDGKTSKISRWKQFLRKRKQLPGHAVLKYGKYLVLVGLVVIGSSFLFTGFVKVPAFCKFLCPSGTLMGAVPLLGANVELRNQAGGLFWWKMGVLIVLLLLSIFVYRPFCQYLCPLGAIYGWFNRFSLVQIRWEKDACTDCGACQKACPVNLKPEQISVSTECIKCGKCVSACANGCLKWGNK